MLKKRRKRNSISPCCRRSSKVREENWKSIKLEGIPPESHYNRVQICARAMSRSSELVGLPAGTRGVIKSEHSFHYTHMYLLCTGLPDENAVRLLEVYGWGLPVSTYSIEQKETSSNEPNESASNFMGSRWKLWLLLLSSSVRLVWRFIRLSCKPGARRQLINDKVIRWWIQWRRRVFLHCYDVEIIKLKAFRCAGPLHCWLMRGIWFNQNTMLQLPDDMGAGFGLGPNLYYLCVWQKC